MEKSELKQLRSALPRGTRYTEINEVLKEKGVKEYSPDYIKNVLLGKAPNTQIIIAAIEVVTKNKEKLAKALEEFKTK